MKKLSIILAFLIVFLPSIALSQSEIVVFDPIATTVKIDYKTYSGILLSEQEYTRYVKMEIDNQSLTSKSEIYKAGFENLQVSYNKLLDVNTQTVDKIIALSKKTWWDENKGWLAMGTGFILGTITAGVIISLSN